MKQIFSKVIDSLDKVIEKKSTKIVFSSPKYNSADFDSKNFHEIADIKNIGSRILFVDGGNANLLESPSFVVSFVRVFGVLMKGNEKLAKEKNEFFILVKAEKSEHKVSYAAEVFPMDGEKRNFCVRMDFPQHSEDDSSVAKAANEIRRFFELQLASKMAETLLQPGDIIMLDGILKTNSLSEKQFMDNLCKTVEQKKLILCSLAKTTNLVTDAGDSALVCLSKMTERGKWYYLPVAEINDENHLAHIIIAKLNKNSKRIFRIEVYKNSKYNPEILFSAIAENSKDPVFLGYPYGLVFADSHARVSNKEKDYMKTIFLKDKKLEPYVTSMDAHDVLDKINF